MMTSLLFIVLATAVSVCHGIDDWDAFRIIWSDEFDTFDGSLWQHEVTASGGGNSEFQLYSQDSANSYVTGGLLFIRPTLLAETRNPLTNQPFGEDFMINGVLNVTETYGLCTNTANDGCYRTGATGGIPPTMSARIRTFQKFSFKYGRAVIRAKMPVGDWLWPAIWMLPEDYVYGEWPRSGEIDLVEVLGNRDLVQAGGNIGIQKTRPSLHWGPVWNENRNYLTSHSKNDEDNNYGDNFHIFMFDWSPNGFRFFVDDQDVALVNCPDPLIDEFPGWVSMWEWGKPWVSTVNPWAAGSSIAPFDQEFHFILNVAVGGNSGFIPDGAVNRGGDPALQKPWNNSDGYLNSIQKFYDARESWQWTWDEEGDNNAMQVDYIRVYQRF